MEENGREIARIDYAVASPDEIIISHTEVNPEMKGQGIGSKILDAVTEHARRNNIRIIASCLFVKAQFTKHKEKYQDVIA